MSHINFVDILIIIPVIWFAYKGLKNGLIMELASLAALFLGIWITFRFSNVIATQFGNSYLARILAFILFFAGTLLLGHFAGKIVEKIVKLVIPGIINKLLGMVFGIFKVLFVFSCLFYLVNLADQKELIFKREFKEQSLLYPYTAPLMPAIIPHTPFTFS
ncbi:MAG: CvpA family protein [Bacteroidales bacterium]|jgi:membrane protein required for colicin V production|nr:CvpA family protein [Bacteroidales bacterium]